MFINETKEIEQTIENVKLSVSKKVEPMVDFQSLNKYLVNNITFTNFNIIQQYTIPVILQGGDLICKALTGSGKTLCYIIPIISKIIKNPNMKAVIICPVRELCDQIKGICKELTNKVYISKKSDKDEIYYTPRTNSQPIKVAAIYGQKRDMDDVNEANILIATPGRLIDNLTKKRLNFDNLGILVFDEADRLYDSTFKSQIDVIKSFISTDIQTCMFSATYPLEIRKIFDLIVKKERTCLEAEFECKTNIKQEIYNDFNRIEKISEALKGLKLVGNWREKVEVEKVIIFVERKTDCLRLSSELSSKGYPSATLHGDKTQFERNEVIKKFKTSISPILIATSVAARGLDIKDIKLVINYDLPRTIDEYIHRIGRTGRAGEDGKAISFFDWNTDGNLSSSLIKVLTDNKQEVPDFLLNPTKSSNYRKPPSNSQRTGNRLKSRSTDKFKSKSNDKYKNKGRDDNIYTPKALQSENLEELIKGLNLTENPAESEDEELGAW